MAEAIETRPAPRPGDVGIASAVLMTMVGGFIDGYLYLRYGVFGFAQTGNVIFMAVAAVEARPWLPFLAPVLAYLIGLAAALVVRTTRPALPRSVLVAMMAFHIVVFAALAVLPATTPQTIFVLALSFVGGIRLELFRTAGAISFVSIATTGNLMRMMQSAAEVAKSPSSAQIRVLGSSVMVVIAFVIGAAGGAAASHQYGPPALWGAVLFETAALTAFLRRSRGRLSQKGFDGSRSSSGHS